MRKFQISGLRSYFHCEYIWSQSISKMCILPSFSIKLVYCGIIFIILLVCARKQVLALLSYLLYVLFEESTLHVVYLALYRSFWHLLERFGFSLDVLCGLKVINPTQRYYSIYSLLIFQVNIFMLIYSSTAPTVHHYLLLFIYGKAALSAW